MASKQRARARTAQRVTAVGVATATVTALVLGAAPPPRANATPPPGVALSPELTAAAASLVSSLAGGQDTTAGTPGLPPMALAPGAPDPALICDVAFGLGQLTYDRFQALGLDPESAINAALGTLLTQALTGIPVDLSGVPARDEQKEIQKAVKSARDGGQKPAGADKTDKAAYKSTGNAGGEPTG